MRKGRIILLITALILVNLLCIIPENSVSAASNTYHYVMKYHESETAEACLVETGCVNGTQKQLTDYNSMGWDLTGRIFRGWKLYRESDHKYMLQDASGTGAWKDLEAGNTLPDGYSFCAYKNLASFNAPAGAENDVVHVYAQWETAGFTVVYHETENSSGIVGEYIPYGNPNNIKIKTIQQLGFSTEYRMFRGWIVKRDLDGKWLIREKGETGAIWQTVTNGQLPEGYEYVMYGSDFAPKTPAKSGNVHFYAVWVDNTNIDVTSEYFGANGSDLLNDRNAIQKALDIGKTSSTTVTIHIPAGTYYLGDPLVIYSDTNLILEQGAKLVLQDGVDMMLTNASMSGDLPGGYNRSKNISITGGTWDGNGTSGSYATNLIYIAHADNVQISNVNMINTCANHFVEFVAVKNGMITSSHFSDFYLATADNYESYLSTVDAELEDRVGALGSVTSEAIQLDYAGEDNSSSSKPYDMTPCQYITIDGCTFENCLSGIGNHHGDAEAEGIVLTNNTFTNMLNTCINISCMKDATVLNNSATNVRRFAHVTAAASDVTFENNTATGKTLAGGITIDSAAVNVEVKSNTLSGFTRCVFADSVQQIKIQDNILKQAGDSGLYFRNVSSSSISGNEVKNCLNNAISISNSECEVKSNTIDAIENNGIYVAGIQGNIENNQILNCKRLNIVANDSKTTEGTTVASRGVILNNRYDRRYGVRVTGSMTRGANYFPADAAEPSIPTTFLIYFHLTENSSASSQITEIEYGTSTKYKTISELGFSVAGKKFIGWKAYRPDEETWRVLDGGSVTWAATVPSGGSYYLYSDGGSLATTVPAGGELHFYAQWETVNTGTKRIISAEAKYDTIAKTSAQEFTVVTSADVKYLMLYAEGGSPLVKTWAASGNSVEGEYSTRIWTVDYSISNAGNRKLVFKGGTTNTTAVTNAVTVPFAVINTGVISATGKYTEITKGSEQYFTIKTTADATYLVEYAEDGKTVARIWTASSSNSTVSGNVRTWNVSQKISNSGKRNLIFKAGISSTTTAAQREVPFSVVDTGVIEASAKYATIGKGGTQTFTVKTTSDAQYLMVYAEGGNLVNTWTASADNSTVDNNVRTWTVSLSIGSAGNRELVMKAGKTTTPGAASRKVAFTVAEKKIISANVKYGTTTKTASQVFTVVTSSDVKYLMLYAEDGKTLVKTWTASGNSVENAVKLRTWTVSHEIGSAGSRKLVLKGGTASASPVTNAATVPFTVVNTGVISVSAKYGSVTKGSAQIFTVKTTADATYLVLYAEDGKTEVRNWTASSTNSTVSGNVRTWTVTHTISTAGNRNLFFNAGSSTTPTAAEREVAFTVTASGVIDVTVKQATIGKGGTQIFTVKTTSDLQYLMLYAENGNLVKTWTASSSNSVVSNNVRTWTVSLAIGGAGDRELILKAGKTSTPEGAGRNVAFKVIEKKIISATAKYNSITKTSEQVFTVTTTSDVKYLMMYAEDGKTLVKSWAASGNSVDGEYNTRIWTVRYSIANPGARNLVFKGGTTNTTPVTNAATVPFAVINTGVISASGKYASINKGSEQIFTIKTTADATTLVEYCEDGKTVARTWTASASNSTVSGNVRTWTLSQTIGTAGNRNLIFRAGSSSTPTDAQRVVSFTVK